MDFLDKSRQSKLLHSYFIAISTGKPHKGYFLQHMYKRTNRFYIRAFYIVGSLSVWYCTALSALSRIALPVFHLKKTTTTKEDTEKTGQKNKRAYSYTLAATSKICLRWSYYCHCST